MCAVSGLARHSGRIGTSRPRPKQHVLTLLKHVAFFVHFSFSNCSHGRGTRLCERELSRCKGTKPPVSVSVIVEEHLLLARTREISDPRWVLPVSEIAEALSVRDLYEAELPGRKAPEPPVSIPDIVEQDFFVGRAGKISDPRRVKTISEIAEAFRVADLGE